MVFSFLVFLIIISYFLAKIWRKKERDWIFQSLNVHLLIMILKSVQLVCEQT